MPNPHDRMDSIVDRRDVEAEDFAGDRSKEEGSREVGDGKSS